LYDLAPEKDVRACCWYEEEKNKDGAVVITRAQRIKYAVHAGLPEDFVEETLAVDVRETINEFKELVEGLSKYTHVTQETFNVDPATADNLAQEALDIFILLFETIDQCMKEIRSEMEDHAREAVDDELFSTTVEALDEIATHHQVYGCNIDHLNLLEMGPDTIKFKVTGSVDCQLQYGSDGDYRRGDGLRVDDNYPLICDLVADIATPLDLKVLALEVDNSSFYE
jgi:Predicted pPIWI-associating nuclease